MGRHIVRAAVVAVAAILGLGIATPAFSASPGPVRTTPASFTPWLLKSTPSQNVQQLRQCGGAMYAVGTVSAIGQGSNTYSRGNAFAFSATTGVMTTWNPQVNGTVRSIAFSPDCSTAYLGGSFSSVRGVAAKNIVAVDTVTGAVRSSFARNANSTVNTLQYAKGLIIAGGSFTSINGVGRGRLASLNPSSGVVTPDLNLAISGTYPNVGTKIYNSQMSHAGTKMLVEGVFTSIGGKARRQIAMLDLGTSSVTVDNWYSNEFDQECDDIESFYVKGANWSPDDGVVYVATTGYKPKSGQGSSGSGPRAGLCDAAAAFPAIGATVTHNWVNYTGCDSLYAVAADANDVYVGGHERWANNPGACDSPGPGAVSRPGIGALSPTTGLATAWNPGRSRGHGANDLLITTAGLWVASDNFNTGSAQKCGTATNKGGICFFPY